NKIDLPSADVEQTMLECMETFDVDESDIVCVSAKTGKNIDILLEKIIEKIPEPTGNAAEPLRALVITSQFDQHRGALAYVRVVDGVLKKENLSLFAGQTSFQPIDLGVFVPS